MLGKSLLDAYLSSTHLSTGHVTQECPSPAGMLRPVSAAPGPQLSIGRSPEHLGW